MNSRFEGVKQQPKLGLALGGGGARGVAHIGVLDHLESIGLAPSFVSGTSAGSIVAVLYAFGFSPDEIDKLARKLRTPSFSQARWAALGLFEHSDLRGMLTEALGAEAKLEHAKLPVAVVATSLRYGKACTFKSGPAIPLVLASCALPGVYLPQEIDGDLLVDGGVVQNIPISAVKGLGAKRVIGVDLNSRQELPKPKSMVDVLSQSLDIMMENQESFETKQSDLVIGLDLAGVSVLQRPKFDELREMGRNAARTELPSKWGAFVRYWWKRLLQIGGSLLPIRVPSAIARLGTQKTPWSD
jgi:NTE family protein